MAKADSQEGLQPVAQQNWQNVTLRAEGTFAPNKLGWDTSALPPFTLVDGALTLQPADTLDTDLFIEADVEYTNDSSGGSGWTLLSGTGWQGGPKGRDQQPTQPTIGPFTTTTWPTSKRLRIHVQPSRSVTNVDAVIHAF